MSVEKKRLKKNLPFGPLDYFMDRNIIVEDSVILFDGIKYYVIYPYPYAFDELESQILNEIWNNPNWFENMR